MIRIGIIIFPGSNCDRDVYKILSTFQNVSVDFVWYTKDKLQVYDAMIIPGGFAYGDRLRAGIIAAHSPVISEIKKMAMHGIPILGICNGFQILVECGLLPGALMTNRSLRFVCKWTTLKIENRRTPFTSLFNKNQTIRLPIAHGQGRYIVNKMIEKRLKRKQQIIMRYFEEDPNGSTYLIAGICNEEGNIMGMMPHPERASEITMAPYGFMHSIDGLTIFKSLIHYLGGGRNDSQYSTCECSI